jgi:hypothetical protein
MPATTKKDEMTTTEWEKISANLMSDMGVTCRIHKEFLQINNKKTPP